MSALRSLEIHGPRIAFERGPSGTAGGSEDVRSPTPVARALHDGIPGSTMTVPRGACHQCNVERARAFNEAVRTFLRRVDGR